jgi:hypothetical protein
MILLQVLEYQTNLVATVVLHEPESQVSVLYIVGEVLEYQTHLVATVVLHEP